MARVAVRFGLGTIVATGIVAGIIFAAFEMFAAALLMGPDAAAMPLRMIGAMVLGAEALEPTYLALIALVVVPREERYLKARFPNQYANYQASVRRWL
ncbi:MAG: hypothetical protein HYU37_11570 [Acidobacteria bacterium]|nr:hypothetical protein [Acidobacteriota bacterium]